MSRIELCKWVHTSDASADAGVDTDADSGGTTPRFESVEYTVTSLLEVARFEFRDSVYTVDRTYPGLAVIKLDAHMDRLEDSARREGIELQIDRPLFRSALREFFEGTGFDLIRFRIAVSRSEPGSFYLAAEEFFPPESGLIDAGVRCSILEGAVRRNPDAKTADWMLDRDQFPRPSWAYEGLLLDGERRILEGATSNFYAIVDDRLLTAGGGVLPGIARQIVLEVAAPEMTVETHPIAFDDLHLASGCFLTSASRGIIPVVQVENVIIADGKRSHLTQRLQDAYDRWVESHQEQL